MHVHFSSQRILPTTMPKVSALPKSQVLHQLGMDFETKSPRTECHVVKVPVLLKTTVSAVEDSSNIAPPLMRSPCLAPPPLSTSESWISLQSTNILDNSILVADIDTFQAVQKKVEAAEGEAADVHPGKNSTDDPYLSNR
jgi:hypothetical protein